jgi:transposase
MQLNIRDPAYTERLASFLRSLGQTPVVSGPAQMEIDPPRTDTDRAELEIYLRVWKVLYPDADVELAC